MIKLKKESYFVLYIILILYIPLVINMTDSVTSATSYNGDIIGYMENLKVFYYGIISGDLSYALNFNTFGYGAGMILFLSILSFPFQMFGANDQILLIILKSIGLLSFIFSCLYFRKILKYMLMIHEIRHEKLEIKLTIFYLILSCFPTTVMLITRVHPEMFQLLVLLMAFYYMLKYEYTNKNSYFIISAILWGYMISIKISGGIFLIIPFIYIMTKKYKCFKQRITRFIMFSLLSGGICMLTLYPYMIIDFNTGLKMYLDELNFFSNTLQTMSISDFDNFKLLSSRMQVLKAWCTYAFSHGYVYYLLSLYALLYIAVKSKIELCTRADLKIKINCMAFILFLTNMLYYTLNVTRISTYYYFIPALIVTFALLYNFINYKINKINYRHILGATIIIICFIPSIRHSFDLYKEQVLLGVRLRNEESRFIPLQNFLLNRSYPYKTLILPTSLNLSLSSKELNWIPDKDIQGDKHISNQVGNAVTEKILYYWSANEILSNEKLLNNPNSLLIVNKFAEANIIEITNYLLSFGMNVIYEDNYSAVFSVGKQSVQYKGINSNIKNQFLSNKSISDKEGNMRIVLKEKSWDGVVANFSPPSDLNTLNGVIVKFYCDNISNIKELRIVINGVCEEINENTWHYVINSSELKEGFNEINVNFQKFILQSGYIDWNNITNIIFGGVITQEIALDNFEFNIY